MFSSTGLVASFVLLGSVLAFPHFPAKRDPGTCIQDNLLRCFTNTKSTAAASAFCAALAPFTATVATVTASASKTITTTVVASTETDGITVLITSTIFVPVVASTYYVDVAKRSVEPPLCYTNLGTTYAASRLTSACSCIGVPASTVSDYTYTISTGTKTIASVVDITITTLVSTTSTVLESDTTYLTTTLTTTTSSPVPTTCGAPSPSNLLTNPSFECGTLSPWVFTSSPGSSGAFLYPSLASSGSSSLYTISNYYTNMAVAGGWVSQTLTTVPGTTYKVSFDMHMDGGAGNWWIVSAGGVVIAMNADGVFGQPGWQSYSGTFVATSTSEDLNIKFDSGEWAYANWFWDNFVFAPAVL